MATPKSYSEFLHDIWNKDMQHHRETGNLYGEQPNQGNLHPGNRQVPVGNMPGMGWNRPDFPGSGGMDFSGPPMAGVPQIPVRGPGGMMPYNPQIPVRIPSGPPAVYNPNLGPPAGFQAYGGDLLNLIRARGR